MLNQSRPLTKKKSQRRRRKKIISSSQHIPSKSSLQINKLIQTPLSFLQRLLKNLACTYRAKCYTTLERLFIIGIILLQSTRAFEGSLRHEVHQTFQDSRACITFASFLSVCASCVNSTIMSSFSKLCLPR